MGEAKRRRAEERQHLLDMIDAWSFPPSDWEAALVLEISELPVFLVPRLDAATLSAMNVHQNQCHANVRRYVRSDESGASRWIAGWWINGSDLVFHSVVEIDGQLICITPSPEGEAEIPFIPDPTIEWTEEGEYGAAYRNEREIGIGIRRFPALTIAMYQMARERLLAGMDARKAAELSDADIEGLQRAHMSSNELASIRDIESRAPADRGLLNPLQDIIPTSLDWNATMRAHGLYSTEQFVLRLSPKVHELVDAVTKGNVEGYDPAEIVRAYSTYLHETVHWWQHCGTTTGVILSLAYPTQCLGSMDELRRVIEKVGPKKPLKRWADDTLKTAFGAYPDGLADANIAVNNALDIDYYKRFQFWPLKAAEFANDPFFESVGHSYLIAYSNTINAITSSCGFAAGSLPDPAGWEARYEALRAAEVEGFYHGSPIRRSRVGLREIMEGQARFIQLQFLIAAGAPSDWASHRAKGFFNGAYIEAFDEFRRLTLCETPDTVTDPLVNLFLLICDLALNPHRGFPLQIDRFEDFILDLDPGARFTLLCEAAARQPDTLTMIADCSAADYWTVSSILTREAGYDDPREGLEAIARIAAEDPGARALLGERESWSYTVDNLPIRVMIAEFLAFARDKLEHPHFFCWAGLYCGGARKTPEHEAIFVDHLSLFSDRADTEQIFPRNFPGKDPDGRKMMLDAFFGSLILYDMTLQWILRDGPFRYDFGWMTGRPQNDELVAWAKRMFKANYAVDPDDFEILPPPVS